MSFAFILYVGDELVGPVLETIRRICSPKSRSQPHVTVRYPVDKLAGNDLAVYTDTLVHSLDILNPARFLWSNGKGLTIFLKCGSETLEKLAYKPDFPNSVFHITLYNGTDFKFAGLLEELLLRFDWSFRVPFPLGERLSRIEIGPSASGAKEERAFLSNQSSQIFETIFSERPTEALLESLDDERRLEYVEKACLWLHARTKKFQRISIPSATVTRGAKADSSLATKGQLQISSLWAEPSDVEFHRDAKQYPKRVRNDGSDFYLTPPELARSVVAYALSKFSDRTALKFGDPCLGNGVFYGAFLDLANDREVGSAIGVELDQGLAQGTLDRYAHRKLEVTAGDFLYEERNPSINFLVANPPYVRFQNIESAYREEIRARVLNELGLRVSGHSGLFVYFILLAHRWMLPGCIAGWILPDEFMETNYGAVIREYLTKRVRLIRLHQFESDEVQFEDAFVAPAILVFENTCPLDQDKVQMSRGGSLESPRISLTIECAELAGLRKWRVPIDQPEDSTAVPTLGSLFDITRGIATGANDFFIIDRQKASELGIPDSFLKPILPKARFISGDIVEGLVDGYPDVNPRLCLFDSSMQIDDIESKFPKVYSFLTSASDKVRNAYLVKSRKPWYRQESRPPPPFVFTYMARQAGHGLGLRFLRNRSQAIASNTYLLLYPTPFLRQLLGDDESRYLTVLSALNNIGKADIAQQGRTYSGGLSKVEPKELAMVPLRQIPAWLSKALAVKHEESLFSVGS